jgi:uncharacterized protein
MLELSQIWVYPIKSLGGISLSSSKVTSRGLEHDRRWLLVDTNLNFITQREHPELALFRTKFQGDFIQVIHIDNEVLIPLNQKINDASKWLDVTVWGDQINAVEVDPEISHWFSKKLNIGVHLVYMPESSLRKVDTKYATSPDDITSFSDGYPFLIIGESSLNDLNDRLEIPVPINRFRPNFVFRGGINYEEDQWKNFRIGSINFQGVKPCSRCVVTTIDTTTGLSGGIEPLFTLSKYRKWNNKIYFGQNLISSQIGIVSIGDAIVVETKREHFLIHK